MARCEEQLGLYLLDVYRSPNIGVFMRANERHLLVPSGLASTKASRLSDYLGVEAVEASIGGSRLIGPLVAMNDRGVLVSRIAEDEEIRLLKGATGLPVERLASRYTAVGNLLVANDKGAIASPILHGRALEEIRGVLDVPVEAMAVASHLQVGSVLVVTERGAVVHPRASEEEIERVSDSLKVAVEPATVNGGVPLVASGVVANSRGAVVGTLTSGPELAILSRAFKI